MKNFLINEFGKDQGEKIYEKYREKYYKLLSETKVNSKNQFQTCKKHILPQIAIYEALQEHMDKPTALETVEKHFFHNAYKMSNTLHKLENLPFFYKVFRMIFAKALNSDNWELSIDKNDNEAIECTIRKCLWHDTCVSHNCPELCAVFCKSDIICYGSLRKITFKRTETLGIGGNFCDFKFINNKAK